MTVIELIDEVKQHYKIAHEPGSESDSMQVLFSKRVDPGTLIVLVDGKDAHLPEPVMVFLLVEYRSDNEIIAMRADLGMTVLRLMQELHHAYSIIQELRAGQSSIVH